MTSYQYQPLVHADSIRVLVLHANSNENAAIECSIRHTTLSDPSISYEALSYVWGEPAADKFELHIDDGSRIGVWKNSHIALQHLRAKGADRIIWIYAVCINQEDLGERSSQVRMMDRIYREATAVVVFLGEHTSSSDIFLEELIASDNEFARKGKRPFPRPTEPVNDAIKELLKRPWFSRIWTLQEAALNRVVQVMCGSKCASFDALQDYVFSVGLTPAFLNEPFPPHIFYMREGQRDQYDTSLWRMLYRTNEYQATDRRDKIFALKSLLGSEADEVGAIIDYNLSIEDVLTRVARLLLSSIGVRVLTAAVHGHSRNMASWVPDWTSDVPLYQEELSSVAVADQRTSERYHILYEPSGLDKRNPPLLSVRACRYGRVKHLSDTFRCSSKQEALERIAYIMSEVHSLGHPQVRKLLLRSGEHGAAESTTLPEPIVAVLDHLDGIAVLNFMSRSRSFSNRRGSTSRPSVASDLSLGESFRNAMHLRRVCLTEDDHLVVAPQAAGHGDVVMIIAGSESPCLLRQREDGTWRLLSGDCPILDEKYDAAGKAMTEGECLACHVFLERCGLELEEVRIS